MQLAIWQAAINLGFQFNETDAWAMQKIVEKEIEMRNHNIPDHNLDDDYTEREECVSCGTIAELDRYERCYDCGKDDSQERERPED